MPTMQEYNAQMEKMAKELFQDEKEKTTTLPIICPTVEGKPCRLCDLAKTILFKKDNDGTPIRQKASDLNRKKNYYSNVILPTNPSDIVPFQYGEGIWKELMLLSMGPASEVKDWLDPRTGRNVIITKTIPGGNKRRTTYTVKPRITSTSLLDMSILRKLSNPECQMDHIVELIKSGAVKPFYQSQLQEGPNELRFLPSWLGPGVTKFFHMMLYHYGVTEEEFAMIQRGDLDPFAGLGTTVVKEASPPLFITSTIGAGVGTTPPTTKLEVHKAEPKSVWDSYIGPTTNAPTVLPAKTATEVVQELKTESPDSPYPPCFGKKFDPNDQECIEDCAADGWTEACKMATESLQRAQVEKRKVAKRLVK